MKKRLPRSVARKTRKLRIGWDFHGTIVDVQPIKQRTALSLFQKYLPVGIIKRELVLGRRILSERQYTKLKNTVFENATVFLQAEPHEGALDMIEQFERDGHDQKIITASDPAAFKTAIRWCEYQDEIRKTCLLTERIPMISVGRNNPKTEATHGLDIYISNDLDDLRPLVGMIPVLILMDRDYNRHEDESGIADRVRDFNDLYIIIDALAS